MSTALFTSISYAQTWNTTGNAGTSITNNFLGTIDNTPFIIKTNNVERFRANSDIPSVIIGDITASTTGVGNTARLELAPVHCNGCFSKWATPGDFVVRNMGGPNLEFHQPNDNAIDPNSDTSTPNSSGISRIKFTDAAHKSNLIIFNTGKITVGTDQYDNDPNFLLYVKKGIKAEQVKVEIASANGWADYVFAKGYKLKTLEEVENHIQEKGHLPNIPSAEEVTKNGVNLGEMDAKLLEKIEELTLYTIELNKQIKKLQEDIKGK
ncbi:hypothetical protein MQX03_19920 [Chryseobacterium aahli]|uniref:hypothetical protein n=1 Tax=Chryseobacterium aahli TaxID=1278643 RepID=UPI001F6040A1|nr:hypothetical protein [Chryseobacterium aahli]MCI3939446.1 hypothetical protein [Chryseobacterium aahli]